MGYYSYMMVAGLLSMVGVFVSNRLKSKFNKYSKIGTRANLSGLEVAQQMLAHYGIQDVKIVQGNGFLSDHYNPMTKTVSLSPQVYQGRSVAAAAVAAHECGHVVQHNTGYAMLQMRSGLVPLVKAASMAQQWLLLGAFMMMSTFPQLMLITIAAFAITTLFSLVTLPVEFDASNRALAWLEQSNITQGAEHDGAKDALWWAAMTYVAAALSALVMVLYLIMQYNNRR
ncbi:MAG: zinc metallopeptidase [Bacteroidota bacterium]